MREGKDCEMVRSERNVGWMGETATFAISPQLFPASLITLSRCSSAGLHGVLVLFFLGMGGACASSGATSGCWTPAVLVSPPSGGGIDDISGGGKPPGVFLLRDGGEAVGFCDGI